MQNGIPLELERDCEATQIPAGNVVMLPAGTPVELTQNLGGSFTVQALGSLFSIAAKDADALGLETPGPEADLSPASAGPVSEEKVWDALKQCYDPEIPVNIVDLGLVYDLEVESRPEGGHRVLMKMTLTAPGCGMGPVIARDAETKIRAVPGVAEAQVELVWDPPWHQSMITPAGRRILGLE